MYNRLVRSEFRLDVPKQSTLKFRFVVLIWNMEVLVLLESMYMHMHMHVNKNMHVNVEAIQIFPRTVGHLVFLYRNLPVALSTRSYPIRQWTMHAASIAPS